MSFKIKEIWAFVHTDEKNEEGIVAWFDEDKKQWMPMVAADGARIESLKPIAVHIAQTLKKEIRMVHFSTRCDVQIFRPKKEMEVTEV